MTRRLMKILILGFAICFCSNVFAMTKEQIETEFQKANEAFRQANAISETDSEKVEQLYETSILHFEKIIDQGQIKNASVYYNLANAYLLKGDIAKAILNYRRSEKMGGLTKDLAKNLAFARSQRVDNIEMKSGAKVLHTLFFWHYDMKMKSRFLLSFLFFGLFFVGLIFLVWFGRRASVIVPSVIFIILGVAFSVSVGVSVAAEAEGAEGVIIAQSVIARQGDGLNYPPSFKEPLHGGTEFKVLRRHPGYIYIELQDGQSRGWVPDEAVEII